MDFPTATWKSHYYQEHLFGLMVASTLEMLISQAYKAIVIVNGHGAWNQLETLDRLAKHYSNTTDTTVVWKLAIARDVSEKNLAGHADLVRDLHHAVHREGSFLAGRRSWTSPRSPRGACPSIIRTSRSWTGAGFSEHPSPGRVVQTDPRDATAEKGKTIFDDTVMIYVELAEETLEKRKLTRAERSRWGRGKSLAARASATARR